MNMINILILKENASQSSHCLGVFITTVITRAKQLLNRNHEVHLRHANIANSLNLQKPATKEFIF